MPLPSTMTGGLYNRFSDRNSASDHTNQASDDVSDDVLSADTCPIFGLSTEGHILPSCVPQQCAS